MSADPNRPDGSWSGSWSGVKTYPPRPVRRGSHPALVVGGIFLVLLILAMALVAAVKLTAAPVVPELMTTPAPSPTSQPTPSPTLSPYVVTGMDHTIATVNVESIQIREGPGEQHPVKLELPRHTSLGVPQTFLVKGADSGWLNVLLPVRPNGSRGWIKAADVKITATNYKLVVHIESRRIQLHEKGRILYDFPIGVGTASTPTPGGEYYIKELLSPPDKNGPYGTYAYGLNGFSEVLEKFQGGDAELGIHGTNNPSSIGKEVSAGCIRLYNEDIEKLVQLLPLGTPVEVIAD